MSTPHSALAPAFMQLRERCAAQVEKIVYRGRLDDPEAAIAEVWAKAWRAYPTMLERESRRLERGLPGHNWRGWLAQIARNVVRDEHRTAKVQRRVLGTRALTRPTALDAEAPERQALDVDHLADDAADPADAVERAQLLAPLLSGLAELPSRQRQVLLLWALGDTDRQIARVLGYSPSRVGVLRRAGLASLRRRLAAAGWGWVVAA